MDVEQFVGQCWDVLHGEGTPLEGCLLEESDAQAEAQRRFPGKPYCLVRQWSRIDLECEPETLAYFARVGLRAAVIFAHQVVFDSASRCLPGSWIRSTYEVTWDMAGFFESEHTVYVLLGPGVQKTAPLRAVLAIH
ncbi:TPA: hypothetical protein L4E92_003585 [Pseudomonas aeruginosa]|nr:hypothetical protein [Pseudomonas aeruginosa]